MDCGKPDRKQETRIKIGGRIIWIIEIAVFDPGQRWIRSLKDGTPNSTHDLLNLETTDLRGSTLRNINRSLLHMVEGAKHNQSSSDTSFLYAQISPTMYLILVSWLTKL